MYVFLIILPILSALVPAYAAFLFKNNKLLILALVSAVLAFFGSITAIYIFPIIILIPWFVTLSRVSKRIPTRRSLPIPFGAFLAYWAVLLLIMLFTPIAKLSISSLGVTFDTFTGLEYMSKDDGAFMVLSMVIGFFIVAFIVTLFLRGKALFIGELILSLLASGIYSGIFAAFFQEGFAALGLYLMLFLLYGGSGIMYYLTNYMCSGVAAPKPAPDNIMQNFSKVTATAQNTIKNATSGMQQPMPSPITIHCLGGEYVNNSFTLKPGENLTMGTNPAIANLIFSSPTVSRLHCTISCSPTPGMVRITDSSSNGTYLENGTRLLRDLPADMYLPCRIYFGDGPQMFEIH